MKPAAAPSAARIVRRVAQGAREVYLSVDPLPIRRVWRGYDRPRFIRDLRAGINGALVAFPQGVACAIIAGLPISYGLFGSAVAGLVGPLFSRSRTVVFGPTNSTSVLLLSAFLAAGLTPAEQTARLPLLLAMVAVLQVVAAYCKVGSLVAYISRSVTVGYITAAAVLIIANQLPHLAGVKMPEAPTLIGNIEATVVAMRYAQAPTVVVSLLTAAIFLALARLAPHWPRIAIALVAGAGIGVAAEHWKFPIEMLPRVEISNWTVRLPALDFAGINQLASAALALAFLGVLEASSLGKSLAARAGERYDTNQEVFALGLGNAASACFGGMPVSGSPTRSVLNFSSGAATQTATMFCSLLLLGLVFGLGNFLAYVPRATLGTVVVLVAASLINRRQIRFVVRSTPTDAVVFAATAGSALLVPLDSAIFIGTATSIVLFLRKAGEPELVEYAFNPAGDLAAVGAGATRPQPEISIVHVEGSLFFGAAELLQEQLRRACEDPNLRILILRLKFAHHLDASAILALEELVHFMRENGRGLIVSGARKEVVRLCRRTGLLDLIGRENFFPEWPMNPTVSTRNALKRAQQLLGQEEATVRIFGETRMKPVDEASKERPPEKGEPEQEPSATTPRADETRS